MAAPPIDPDRGESPSVWRFVRASRAHVVVDAADYFEVMQIAMKRARQRIMLIGWDFDTRIHLGSGRRWWNRPSKLAMPARLGAFIVWLCKRTPGHVAEALECLGGSGYVEESIVPRTYREAPLNSIWEGSGNVICLDVLRAMSREPHTFDALLGELRLAAGADRRLDALIAEIEREAGEPGLEDHARRFVEKLALALSAALLCRHAPTAVADAFVQSRLAGDWGRGYGTLPAGTDFAAILARARPY